jgi:hypothetical protein
MRIRPELATARLDGRRVDARTRQDPEMRRRGGFGLVEAIKKHEPREVPAESGTSDGSCFVTMPVGTFV